MRAHLSNAAYGVLDYMAHPIGMLIIAPIVLRNLGVAQYGVWAVATAAVSAGSIIASGFGDANIQHIASQRSVGDSGALLRVVRSTMGIHLVMGSVIALISWMLAPYLAAHVSGSDAALQSVCLWSLRIASVLMLVRAIESVCISTQRAFERYGAAVKISIAARLLTLVAAAGLTYVSRSVVSIMVATAVLIVLGVWLQLNSLKKLLHADSLVPAFDKRATKALFAFGIFSWLQAISGVIFSQTDRLVTGVSLGAATVATYALCVQLAQPIYGLAASGLHFLFPFLSARRAGSAVEFRRSVLVGLLANLLLVAAGVSVVLLFGDRVLHSWAGASVAETAKPILPLVAWSSALMGLNVTGSYAMLALGRVRTVTWLNLSGGAVMIILILWLLPHYGVWGVAAARLSYGPITLLLYIPLALLLRPDGEAFQDREIVHPHVRAKTLKGRPKKRKMQAAKEADVPRFANLLGIQVEALDMRRAVSRVKQILAERRKGYVCMIGAHGIMEAQRNPGLATAYADSILKVPDGMPTVWVGRAQGCTRMQRVAGPDLMLEIFRRKDFAGYTHFLYGGKEGIADELAAGFTAHFPWARIVGTWTPPFRDLSPSEEENLIATIHQLKPDIIWVGISTPKQDRFMQKYLAKFDTTLMFGVGAAFDFHTGRIRDCADWVKRAGLQWLHRLLQDPHHLWRRYLRNNPAFLWCIALQLTGLRKYPTPKTTYETARTPNRVVAEPRKLHELGPIA
jgi:exopolysaccharide biosynthesis WecB/TagA/CpsF family protein